MNRDSRGRNSQSMMWYSSSSTWRQPLNTLSYRCLTSLKSCRQKFHNPEWSNHTSKILVRLRMILASISTDKKKAWSVTHNFLKKNPPSWINFGLSSVPSVSSHELLEKATTINILVTRKLIIALLATFDIPPLDAILEVFKSSGCVATTTKGRQIQNPTILENVGLMNCNSVWDEPTNWNVVLSNLESKLYTKSNNLIIVMILTKVTIFCFQFGMSPLMWKKPPNLCHCDTGHLLHILLLIGQSSWKWFNFSSLIWKWKAAFKTLKKSENMLLNYVNLFYKQWIVFWLL